ncbi:hypothetical protein JQ554_14525 [Bradyrhizobium diazoefficiens]|nr:hypothetical protein [Bradyrhizobium diazoefficiens]UCF50919.1 MAG: hypothetical protein JSV48_15165 [Bradyrhizobium sp.]MBR0964942.1 hypothetical protein [Bradyrhizobium diazoefficiens]MBR0976505.1 hypothetical protein [Bradyrhizobium diazoefficiens]MBR1008393.1 hypothetical protein [Bradyrhizobium diazoefficiens]MBR1014902.1 hypothetical protein [Bradyrhizobium diazoefficiens]
MTLPVRFASDRSLAIAVLAILAAVSVLPVLLTPIPAMVDYPNHLARMYILSQNGTPDANPYYEVAWAFYPNLAMDLLVPQMARLTSVENATRMFLLLSQVLIVGGALLLEWARKGRVHLAGFAALAVLYCLPFSWGFVNFEFGLGLALSGIAVYLMLADGPWPLRFVANTIFVAALFAAHFFSLGIYGATLGFFELSRLRHERTADGVAAARLGALAIPALVLFAIMHANAGAIGSEGTSWFLGFKPIWPLRIMNGYNLTVAAATGLALGFSLLFAARRGALKLEPSGIWLATGFAILYVVIPSKLFGTSFVDLRVIPAAALILPAFCSLSLPSRTWRMAALAGISGIILINLAVVLSVWLPYRADYAAMIESFSKLDRGARVLVASTGDAGDPPFADLTSYPMYYAPTLAVHYANAFVPNLFTEAGKQPVRARESVRRLAIPYGGPVPSSLLATIAAGEPLGDVPLFIRSWDRDYDYLYVLGPPAANPMPDLLEVLDTSRRFVLYRIRRRT